MRQVVLDTETTGLELAEGHRVIEIGAVEIVNRMLTGQVFHHYLYPDREIDAGALEVHGISLEELRNKPRFYEIAQDFIDFIRDSELIIHNAAFDVAFLNAELARVEDNRLTITDVCTVFDTLTHARQLHPGQRNTLDALCKRYEIDNSQREVHGALLDAKILADVYLAMTGGQVSLGLSGQVTAASTTSSRLQPRHRTAQTLQVLAATEQELLEHEKMLDYVARSSVDGDSVWSKLQ